ncbi:MAG: radical SAM protein [Candidatus Hodarchaeota archaeon]
MLLKSAHFLLTYVCNLECDHCFVYSGPNVEGTFTLKQIRNVLDELAKIGTVKSVYFEGGEPFLFYPLMCEGIRIAKDFGFKTGVVTNAYWAISEEDAELWLEPLHKLEVADISISDDLFHYENEEMNPAKLALTAGKRLGMPASVIRIDKPTVESIDKEQPKGKPVIGGSVMFRGRAVEKLIEGLPKRPGKEFTECPYEDLENPERIHLDPFGEVHICQGLGMGNMWKTPLSKIIETYDASSHPICGPLVKGGPALLAEEYNVEHDNKYVDACHFCYLIRLALLTSFPQYLAPRQVYGQD